MLEPLRHGPLIVWVVGPASAGKTGLQQVNDLHHATPITYQEQTSGSFGQSASNFGQNAGSYGQPSDTQSISTPKAAPGENAPAQKPDGTGYHEQNSGSFGQAASSYGTGASAHGQNAGSFGQTAGSYGTAASNHGQTAGSFGNSTSTIAQAGQNGGRPVSRLQGDFALALRGAFPALQVKYLDVAANELKDRLTAAEGTADFPDVLVGALPDAWGLDLRRRFVMETIQPAGGYADGLAEVAAGETTVSILVHARHRDAARALALWASEAGSGCAGCLETYTAKDQPYAAVAVQAASRLLQGVAVAELADPEMAAFPAMLGRTVLMTSANTPAEDGAVQVEVVRASVNGRLAVVSLRAVAASDGVFGMAHPLVVLRRSEEGQWRVLHVSLNLPAYEAERARKAMMNTAPSAVAETKAGVMGVKLASPQEGDTRPLVPDLAWDNLGGAGLQVVEWQRANGDRWSDARLFLVPDRGSRLATQVKAEFAVYQSRYRWRVWSVGAQGEMKISAWRTMNIQP